MTRNTLRTPFLLAGTALAIASCNRTEAPAAAAAAVPTQAEATAIVDGAEAQWNSGDAARIMALYKDGAVMFDVAAPAPSNDRATQTRWTEAFAAMRLTGFRAPDRRVQVLDADTIISSGTGTFDSGVPTGPRQITIRYTDVYEKQADGHWLIVHEHLSNVPTAPGGAA